MKNLYLSTLILLFNSVLYGQTTLYTEDFEGGAIPTGWGQQTNATDGGFKFGNSGALSSQFFTVPPHTNMAGTNDDGCNCDKSDDLLFTDTINLAAISGTVFLKFSSFYYAATYNGATERATVEVSTDGGVNFTSLKTLTGNENWTDELVNLTTYAGQEIILGFRYNDGGGWLYGWAIDDLEIFQPVSRDAELTENSIPNYFDIDNAPLNITGSITNFGGETITEIDISYSVSGGTSVTDKLTGLSVAPLSTYDFTLPTNWNPTATGNYSITLQVEGINGSTDEISGNDAQSKDILIYKDAVQRMPLYEIFTSSTCGPCLPGNENFHNVTGNFPGEFVEIKYQQDFPGSGDPYCTDEALARRNYYAINSIPRMEIDGGWDQNASSFTANLHTEAREKPSFMELTGSFSVDADNQTVTSNFEINPLQTINSNDMRLMVAIIEKRTTKNIKSNGETEFIYVMKKMIPNENGELIPGGLTQSNTLTFNKDFEFVGEYRLPLNGSAAQRINHTSEHSIEDFNNLTVVAWLQDLTTKEVFQAVEATNVTSVNNNISINENIQLYPNPMQNEGIIEINLNESSSVEIEIFDISGKKVFVKDLGNLPANKHIIPLNLNQLNFGMYLVNVKTSNFTFTSKLSIAK